MMRIFSLLAILASISNAQTQWTGSFTLQGSCPAACCCAGTAVVAQSGTTLSVSGVTLTPAANCGGVTTLPATTGTLSSATATSGTVIFNGQPVVLTLSGDSVSTFNAAFPNCNTVLTRQASGGGSSNPCFHTDTVITYAGKEHTFDEIRAHPECSIPHVVRAHGVIVTAKCGVAEKTLKLTDGHLVYTQRGLQAAGDLKPGQDTVYADIAESTKCEVVSISKETQQHDYFGLNCINSQVLASGLKSSTFEKLHSVPAFWMQIMGRVLGIKRASAMGDYIADLVHKMNLI